MKPVKRPIVFDEVSRRDYLNSFKNRRKKMKNEYKKKDLKNKKDLLSQKRRDKREKLKPFLEEIKADAKFSVSQSISVFEGSDVKITPL